MEVSLRGQCWGETGGVARGVAGAEPAAVYRQGELTTGAERPIADRLEVLPPQPTLLLPPLLLQTTAVERSTRDTALKVNIFMLYQQVLVV
jgi:hypothetical protein